MSPRSGQIFQAPNASEGSGGGAASTTQLIDLYLDGVLDERARRDFEQRLNTDATLRAQLNAARAADSWLKRTFAAPADDFAASALAAALLPDPIPMPVPHRKYPRWIPYGVAAMLALGAAAAWQYGLLPGGGPRNSQDPSIRIARGDAATWFRHTVKCGFKPEWVCKDDAELARYSREKFGHEWKIDAAPELRLIGWAYTNSVLESEYSSVLLAKWQGQRIALVADHVQMDREVKAAPDGSIKVFKRTLGDTVVYEVTPLDKPVLLDRIHVTD